MGDYDNDGYDDREEAGTSVHNLKNNVLPLWGNERSMNLNPLILTNIQSSHYFKVNLYELKTYHEVIDEIYYKVAHLEPWEKGSRKTAGQTGMCGGVRGVGAGGIVSTAFCLLYKLFTLKLTRKQVIGLITHPDSPYIRVLGFMYIRYTQPPADLWDWYEPYLDDTEELDVKAGGGQIMTIGNILKNFLCKLEWFSTLFPRIPVPIQQKLERKMSEKYPAPAPGTRNIVTAGRSGSGPRHSPSEGDSYSRNRSTHSRLRESASTHRDNKSRSPARHADNRSRSRDRYRDEKKDDRHNSSGENKDYRDKDKYRSSDKYRHRDDYKDSKRHRHRSPKYESDYLREDRDRKHRDDYRESRKYKDEYISDKNRRSYTPERHRSHPKEDKSRYRSSDDERHNSDRRKHSEEKYRYDDEMQIQVKRSKYD